MTKHVGNVQTHFRGLTVVVADQGAGSGIYDMTRLRGDANFRVLATWLYQFDDGSTELVFTLFDPNGSGAILTKAASRFAVVKLEEAHNA